MSEQRLTLLLLPGMDGTGELFAEFVKLLPGWIKPVVLRYPRDRKLSYDQLSPILKSALPSDEPFIILAESFSTPLAIWAAAETPKGLKGLVLCAGFIFPPRRGWLSRAAFTLAPVLFTFGLPASVCRRLLAGKRAPKSLVESLRSAISSVSSGVLACRLKSALSCNAEAKLEKVSVPVLYLSGTEDRLISRASFNEIKKVRPDALLASLEAPHLILQSKPRESVDAVVKFLQQICPYREEKICSPIAGQPEPAALPRTS